MTDVITRIVGIEEEGHTATGPETGQIPQIRQTSGGEFLIKTAAKGDIKYYVLRLYCIVCNGLNTFTRMKAQSSFSGGFLMVICLAKVILVRIKLKTLSTT